METNEQNKLILEKSKRYTSGRSKKRENKKELILILLLSIAPYICINMKKSTVCDSFVCDSQFYILLYDQSIRYLYRIAEITQGP